MVIDDDKNIAELNKIILETLGYRVSAYTSSLKALDVFKKTPERFDLILTDMTMPDLTGSELSRQMLSIKSETPIIICTGFSDNLSKEQAMILGIRDYLMKPMTIEDLSAALRRILDEVPE